MTDIFGYKKVIKPVGELANARHATLNLGDGPLNLIQSVQWSYTNQMQPRYESGSSTVFWQQGHSQGVLRANKLVGKEGFLSAFRNVIKNACTGQLRPVHLSVGDGDACVEAKFSGVSLTLDGVIATSVGGSWNTNQLDVMESIEFLVAAIS